MKSIQQNIASLLTSINSLKISTWAYLILFSLNSLAGNYTWTGATSTSWTTTTNWNPNGNPSTNDSVTIKAATRNCLLGANTTVKQFTLISDTIDLGGNTLTVSNNLTTNTGFITNGTLKCSGTGTASLGGGTISVTLNITANSIQFSGGTYNNAVTAVKKGAGSSTGTGGCTFSSTVSLTDSGSGTGSWTLANSTSDTWNDKVTVTQAGTGSILISNHGSSNSFLKSVTFKNTSAGNIYCDNYGTSSFHDSLIVNSTGGGDIIFGLAGGITTLDTSIIVIGSSGFSSTGELYLSGIKQLSATKAISLTATGTSEIRFLTGTEFDGRLTVSAPHLFLDGGRFLGVTSLTHTGTNTNTSIGSCYFGDSTTITHHATSGSFYLGVTKVDTFNAPVTILNDTLGKLGVIKAIFYDEAIFIDHAKTVGGVGAAGTVKITFLVGDGGTCTFYDSLTIKSDSADFVFGTSAGAVEFKDSAYIKIDSSYIGNLKLMNTKQLGSHLVNVPFQNNSGILYLDSASEFNASVTCHVKRVQLNGTKFNSSFYLIRNGTDNDTSAGGNTFNGNTTIIDSNSTTGKVFALANKYTDDFNGQVTFRQYGSGKILPAHTKNTTFAGDIVVDGNSDITFGYGGGKVILDDASNRVLSKLGSNYPIFKKLEMKKNLGTFTLTMPLTVTDSVIFTKGDLITDSVNLLIIPDNGVVSGANDSSLVIGSVMKAGNDTFTFPIGVEGYYHPLSISAPSSTGDTFTARYFPYQQTLSDSMDTSLIYVNECDYWGLLRNSGSSNVNVELAWNSNSCPVYYLEDMRVAMWNGLKWKDIGNAVTSGNNTIGSVISATVATSFSFFSLSLGGNPDHCDPTIPGVHYGPISASQIPGFIFDGSSTPNIFIHNGDFTIDHNFQIMNGCTLHFDGCFGINVQGGNQLTIDNSELTRCNLMWRGISLDANSSLIMRNTATIEGADIGINCRNYSQFDIRDSRIWASRIGVRTEPNLTGNFNLISGFMIGSVITYYGAYLNQCPSQSPIGGLPDAGMELNDVIMTIGNDAAYHNFISEVNVGILSRRSILQITNTLFSTINNSPGAAYSNFPFNGFAVVGLGGSSAYSLTLLPCSAGTIVADVDNGVYTDQINASILGVDINVSNTGIFSTRCNQNMQTLVSNCLITAQKFGINWKYNSGSASMTANSNTINMQYYNKGKGIALGEFSSLNATANYKIIGNTDIEMLDGIAGIFAQSSFNPIICFNPSIARSSSALGNNFSGISLLGCRSARVSCNSITGYSSSTVGTFGISTSLSPSSYIHCNTVDDTRLGLEFAGNCLGTNINGNELNNHWEGLRLESSCFVGVQTRGSNRFLGSFGSGFGAVNKNSTTNFIVLQNKFKVYSSSSTIEPIYDDGSHGVWFAVSGSSWDCSIDPTVNPDCGIINQEPLDVEQNDIDVKIALDSIYSSEFELESKQMAKKYLYDKLTDNPALLDEDTNLYNFYNSLSGSEYAALKNVTDLDAMIYSNTFEFNSAQSELDSAIDTLTNTYLINAQMIADEDSAADSLREANEEIMESINENLAELKELEDDRNTLRSEQVEDASEANEEIESTDTVIIVEKAVNSIYFATVAQGVLEFTNEQKEALLELSNICPFIGGNAVYRARSLYSLVTDTLVYNDSLICAEGGSRFGKLDNSSTIVPKIAALIVPNPAQEHATIYYSINNNCNFEITDLSGRALSSYKLECNKKELAFSTSELADGLYLYRIVSGNCVIASGKLSVNK